MILHAVHEPRYPECDRGWGDGCGSPNGNGNGYGAGSGYSSGYGYGHGDGYSHGGGDVYGNGTDNSSGSGNGHSCADDVIPPCVSQMYLLAAMVNRGTLIPNVQELTNQGHAPDNQGER